MTPLEPQTSASLRRLQAAVLEWTADRLSGACGCFTNSPARRAALAGGVAANQAIAARCRTSPQAQTTLIIPPPALCTDNGAMIAWAGAERLALGMIDTMDAAPRTRWLLDANATAPAGFSNTRAGF
jgi:N6-L-threonylcarbamoyladenine synthase